MGHWAPWVRPGPLRLTGPVCWTRVTRSVIATLPVERLATNSLEMAGAAGTIPSIYI